MRHTQEEFQRAVNPDELRAWIFDLVKKHPEGGYLKGVRETSPAGLPRHPDARFNVYVHRSQSDKGNEKALGASCTWDFGTSGLKVTIFLNPDGTAVDIEDEPPWAKGITFSTFHK